MVRRWTGVGKGAGRMAVGAAPAFMRRATLALAAIALFAAPWIPTAATAAPNKKASSKAAPARRAARKPSAAPAAAAVAVTAAGRGGVAPAPPKLNPDDPEQSAQSLVTPAGDPTAARPRRSATPTSLTLANLSPTLDAILSAAQRGGRWGVSVGIVETGQTLYESGVDRRYIPASNRKIFTCALALDQLGADYKLRSYLYRVGTVGPDGTLNGNLVVLPQGDPTFCDNRLTGTNRPSDWVYQDWVEKVRSAGIKRVQGDLLIDCGDWNLADLQPKGWPARIRSDYYAVPPSPLTINENVIEVRVKPGAPGQPPLISFNPPAEGYPVQNRAVSAAKGGAARIERSSNGMIEVTGTAGRASSASIPCDNSALFAAAVLRTRLRDAGISVSGKTTLVTKRRSLPPPTAENVVAMYESPPLSELVKVMMKNSNNHFAEQIYVMVSALKLGRGSYTASRELEAGLLRRAGIDTRGIVCDDGSGLSERNAVTPTDVAKMLRFMTTHPAGRTYYESMAVGGRDGTLRRRMAGGPAEGRVHAKTGTINGVSCLSGYLALRPDRTLVFSFLVNDVRGGAGGMTAVQNRLCETLAVLQL